MSQITRLCQLDTALPKIGDVLNTARRMLSALGLAAEPLDGTWVPIGDYGTDVQPPAIRDSGPLTHKRALGLPAVYRAVQLISGMAAQLSVDDWRGAELVEPASPLVKQPDPWRELDSWIERFCVNLATDGNNFTRDYRNSDQSIAAMEILDPFRTHVVRDILRTTPGRAGRVVKLLRYTDDAGNNVELKPGEYTHTWGLEVPGMTRGLGPIGWCRLALTGVLDVRSYADRWFREESVDGVLSTEQRIDAASAKQYKRAWYGLDETDDPDLSRRTGPQVKVIGAGLKYDPIMLRPEDAQWIQAQNFGILDVARMFGVPADYLIAAVEGSSLTYANLEMIDAQFLRTTLFPAYLRKIENALSAALPRGRRARFKTGELLRPDAKTRAEIDQIYLPLGVYSREEVRTREGIAGPAPAMPSQPTQPAQPARQGVSQ